MPFITFITHSIDGIFLSGFYTFLFFSLHPITWIVSILFSFNSMSKYKIFWLKIRICFKYPTNEGEEEDWCPLYGYRFRIFTNKIDRWRHNAAREKYRKWDALCAGFSNFFHSWFDFIFYKTHRSAHTHTYTPNPVLQVEEWWWQNTAVNILQWEIRFILFTISCCMYTATVVATVAAATTEE